MSHTLAANVCPPRAVRHLDYSVVSRNAGRWTGRERLVQPFVRACTAPGSTMTLGRCRCHRNICLTGPVSVGARCAINGRARLTQPLARSELRAAIS